MDVLIEKYKVSISIITIVAVLLWVATTSRVVTAKEETINNRLNNIERHVEENKKVSEGHIHFLRGQINECDKHNTIVKSNIAVIRTNMDYMLKAVDRMEEKLDEL